MDRRQQKTHEAIFRAFADLLTERSASAVTVQEIIDRANVGRATFYAHFETKEQLLTEMSETLFAQVIDEVRREDADGSVFLRLLCRLNRHDGYLTKLLGGSNRDLFMPSLKASLQSLIRAEARQRGWRFADAMPEDYAVNHIAAAFVETVRWWVAARPDRSPAVIETYFWAAVQPLLM